MVVTYNLIVHYNVLINCGRDTAMTVPTKKQMKQYQDFLKREAKKFRLTSEDLSNLTDLGMMIDWQTWEYVLKPNKMDKWFKKFCDRIEWITLYKKKRLK